MKTSLTQRLHAALFFMLAGAIPGVLLLLYGLVQQERIERGTSLSFLLVFYLIIPGILAAISGFVIGADILNPDKVRRAWQAAVRGFCVSLAAWLAYNGAKYQKYQKLLQKTHAGMSPLHRHLFLNQKARVRTRRFAAAWSRSVKRETGVVARRVTTPTSGFNLVLGHDVSKRVE